MDRKTEQRIKKLNHAGFNYREISEKVGFAEDVVRRAAIRLGLYPVGPKPAQYTVYDQDGNVQAFGTSRECADAMGIQLCSFYSAVTRCRKKKSKRIVRERF